MSGFSRDTLSNGLTFLYRQSAQFPLTAATLLLRTGSCDETPRQAGLASFTMELLVQGTRKRSAKKIAEEVESIGASFSVHAAEDYSNMGFVAPAAHTERLLGILAESLIEPAFPAGEIKKERASVLNALDSRKDAIFNYAFDLLSPRLYGSHAYGRPVDGTAETVKRFTREQFKTWHRDHLHPEGAIFSMIGPAPVAQAKKQVERALRNWKKPTPAGPRPLQPIPLVSPQTHKAKSRFEQAYYMVGMPAPSVMEKEYVTLKVLNTIMGGGMSSRLFLRLREDLGLAYEVSSFYPTHLQTSQWVVYLGLPKEKLAVAKKELAALLETLRRQPPTKDEVRQAGAMIRGSYLMEHQSRRRQAWYAAWWEFLGKGPRYDQEFLRAIEAVQPKHVHELAQKLLSQPRVTIEVVPK